jgi:fatty-acyl-CoA synthase
MLPHRTIAANLDAIAIAAELDVASDVLVSWLPLYHDMGLIGLLFVPMTTGCALVLGAPQDFMARPLRWMEWISQYGGTATAGPNFAWAVTTRALRRSDKLDLSRLRVALSGAEPVDPQTVRDFVEAASRHGMRPEAVFPAFGMAEVAIAGTFPEPMRGLRTDLVDRKVLETEGLAVTTGPGPQTKELVLLGKPVPGLEFRICDPDTGRERAPREVGEVEIRGTSVTPGYYRDDAATAAAFRGEWLRTGDLGYMVDGELVVCGRMKDVIIVGGRNVFPDDIERAAARVEGIRAGNVIAFGVEDARGRERIVVVAETRLDSAGNLADRVVKEVLVSTGETVREVVLLPPGTLPKTSSGKLQRSLTRRRYLEGALSELALVGA